MKTFTKSFSDFIAAQFIPGTKPQLIWERGTYRVTWYYSEQTIKRLGAEIIL